MAAAGGSAAVMGAVARSLFVGLRVEVWDSWGVQVQGFSGVRSVARVVLTRLTRFNLESMILHRVVRLEKEFELVGLAHWFDGISSLWVF